MGEYRDIFAFVGLLSISCGSIYLVYRGWVFWLWVSRTVAAHEFCIDNQRERLSMLDSRVSSLEWKKTTNEVSY
jgi:hypothetical protein